MLFIHNDPPPVYTMIVLVVSGELICAMILWCYGDMVVIYFSINFLTFLFQFYLLVVLLYVVIFRTYNILSLVHIVGVSCNIRPVSLGPAVRFIFLSSRGHQQRIERLQRRQQNRFRQNVHPSICKPRYKHVGYWRG